MKILENAKESPDLCIRQCVLTTSAAGEDSWTDRLGTVRFVYCSVQDTSKLWSAEEVITLISQNIAYFACVHALILGISRLGGFRSSKKPLGFTTQSDITGTLQYSAFMKACRGARSRYCTCV